MRFVKEMAGLNPKAKAIIALVVLAAFTFTVQQLLGAGKAASLGTVFAVAGFLLGAITGHWFGRR